MHATVLTGIGANAKMVSADADTPDTGKYWPIPVSV